MPLPKATAEKVLENSKNVFFDSMSSTVCMKRGTGSRKNACLEFIKYVNSDEALIMFTEKTGALRGYTYDIPDSVIGKLTPFSQSLVKYVKNADVVYRYTSDTFYNKNYDTFKYDRKARALRATFLLPKSAEQTNLSSMKAITRSRSS